MASHGTHTYEQINWARVDAILNTLIAHGSIVTGDNPWTVNTKNHGVILKGEWNEAAQTLAITVKDAAWYASSKAVWENIDALMSKVSEIG